jgi:hypothetical protein
VKVARGFAPWTLVLALLLGVRHETAAQSQLPSWFSIDSTAAIDRQLDTADARTGVLLDSYLSARLGPGLEIYTRPFVQRLGSGEWNRQVWLAAMRYERKGAVGLRVEGGLIPAPIGLANLTLRPQLNPTIGQPSSLFQGLPAPEPFSPRVTLLGAIYPFGVSATLSGTKWDARAAVIDVSPLRARRIFGELNPPRFMNVVVGGGVTPIIGLRFGASVTRGGWKRASERPLSDGTLDATVVSVETEFAFRYTKLAGEYTRDILTTTTGEAVTQGWYIQGQQTLTPRWFAAARFERIDAPVNDSLLLPVSSAFLGVEETLGYRLTPDLTLRLSHRARRVFGQNDVVNQALGSIVWARRWF